MRNARIYIGGRGLAIGGRGLAIDLQPVPSEPVPFPEIPMPALPSFTGTLTITHVDGYPVADQEEAWGALCDSANRIFGRGE
jgi:hypothetical protein